MVQGQSPVNIACTGRKGRQMHDGDQQNQRDYDLCEFDSHDSPPPYESGECPIVSGELKAASLIC
jgi:hypothetical protein